MKYLNSIIVEFQYSYSMIYFDYKGRFANSFLDVFPEIDADTDDEQEYAIIRLSSEDDNMILILSPCKCGIKLTFDNCEECDQDKTDKLELFMKQLEKLYSKVYKVLKLEENSCTINIVSDYKIKFDDESSLSLFRHNFIGDNKKVNMLVEQVDDFSCFYKTINEEYFETIGVQQDDDNCINVVFNKSIYSDKSIGGELRKYIEKTINERSDKIEKLKILDD